MKVKATNRRDYRYNVEIPSLREKLRRKMLNMMLVLGKMISYCIITYVLRSIALSHIISTS